MKATEMKVTYIDPDMRQLFVEKLPDGGYGVWSQKDKHAPRKLMAASIRKDGYKTFEDAQHALDLYVSNKRYSGPGNASWEVLVNGKATSWNDYSAMVRGELSAPSAEAPAAIVSLANIEYRIAVHIQGVYENILEVGRCLNEAKEAGLVPHGQWEAWVRKNTGMGERSAQKLMQAARCVHAGSAMERLPISKIQAILSLPEAEREPMAERATTEDMSLRELQEAVKREKQRADQLADEKDKSIARAVAAERELDNLKADLPKLAENLADEYVEKAAEEMNALREQLEQARAKASAPAASISPEAQAEIDRLTRELAEVERYAEQQAELRQHAQQELLNQRVQTARGESAELSAFGCGELAAAVQAFMGAAGILPHLGASIAQIAEAERIQMRQYVDMVATWVEGARQALAAVIIEEDGIWKRES